MLGAPFSDEACLSLTPYINPHLLHLTPQPAFWFVAHSSEEEEDARPQKSISISDVHGGGDSAGFLPAFGSRDLLATPESVTEAAEPTVVPPVQTAVGSTAVGSTAVGSTAVSSAIARSSVASSLAAGSIASSSSAISFTAANASTASTPIASAALLSATDDRDPYVEWGSDSGSSGIGHDGMGGYPMNSDEEEMREAYLRLEDRAACEQNRVRAEIDAADRTASDAQASARPVAVARLAALRAGISADSDSDWDPDSLVEQMVSDYAIAQLREVIANHRILLGLSLIPVSQLSRSIHNHDRHLELQTTQQSILCEMTGHAVATQHQLRMPFVHITVDYSALL